VLNKLFCKLSSLLVIQLLITKMTEKNSNFSLNDETLTNVELLHDEQHQNFLIIDSSSEDDVENPTLKLTLRQIFQT
jgi:hypothetical protein